MTVRRAADSLPLVVHLRQLGLSVTAVCTWPVAAVLLVVDPISDGRGYDPALGVQRGAGPSPRSERRAAVLLTDGKSLRVGRCGDATPGDGDPSRTCGKSSPSAASPGRRSWYGWCCR